MEVDRTNTQESEAITQGRGEEVGHETPGRETPKRNKGDGIHQERNGEDGC